MPNNHWPCLCVTAFKLLCLFALFVADFSQTGPSGTALQYSAAQDFFICLQTFMNGVNSLEFDAAHVTYTFRERHFELFTRAPRKSRQKSHAIRYGNLRFTDPKFGNYGLPSSELQCALFNIRSLIDKASVLNDIITDTNLDMHFLRDPAGAQWLTQFKLDYTWIHVF